MGSSRHLVGFSGPASARELAVLRAKDKVLRHDLDFDPLSRMPAFRGVGADETGQPQGGLVPLVAFAVGISVGWFLLGYLLPKTPGTGG